MIERERPGAARENTMTRLALIADLHFGREIRHLLHPTCCGTMLRSRPRPDHIVNCRHLSSSAPAPRISTSGGPPLTGCGPVDRSAGHITDDSRSYDQNRLRVLRWPRVSPTGGHISQDTRKPDRSEPREDGATLGSASTPPSRCGRLPRNRSWPHTTIRLQIEQGLFRSETGTSGRLRGWAVVIAHHSFHQNPEPGKEPPCAVRRRALEGLSDCGPHVILSGHLHSFLVRNFRDPERGRSDLAVHCGSSTSTRHRAIPKRTSRSRYPRRSESTLPATPSILNQVFTLHSRYSYAATTSGWSLNARSP